MTYCVGWLPYISTWPADLPASPNNDLFAFRAAETALYVYVEEHHKGLKILNTIMFLK